MARSFWNGTISFGLVVIPVQLKVAVHPHPLAFRVLHKKCLTRPKQVWFCERDEVYFDNLDTVRGYEYAKGKYVEIDDKDLDNVPIKTAHDIEIAGFIDMAGVDPIFFDQGYYVEPQKNGGKPFELLRRTLAASKKASIARVTLQKREHVCLLRPLDNIMVLHTMYYKDEVEPLNEISLPDYELHKAELDMAATLVENMDMKFKPEAFHDGYREELMKLIKSKLKGEKLEVINVPEVSPRADLLAALKASVAAARKRDKTTAGEHKGKA
jgi:DNA end-binding protein Ku